MDTISAPFTACGSQTSNSKKLLSITYENYIKNSPLLK